MFFDIGNILRSDSALSNFFDKYDSGKSTNFSVASSMRPFVVAGCYLENPKTMLVVVPGEKNAQSFYYNLATYIGFDNLLYFSNSKDVASNSVFASMRLQSINTLTNSLPYVIVCSAKSLIRKIPSNLQEFCKPFSLLKDNDYNFERFLKWLASSGYTRLELIDGPGTFSVKGGIIDVFPSNLQYPIRLDFFGDALDDIMRIVASTGQKISSLDSVDIFPATDIIYNNKNIIHAKNILDNRAARNADIGRYLDNLESHIVFDEFDFVLPYMYKKMHGLWEFANNRTIFMLDEPRAIFDDITRYNDDLKKSYNKTGFNCHDLYFSPAEVRMESNFSVSFVSILTSGSFSDARLTVKRPPRFKNIEHLSTIIKDYYKLNYYVVLNISNSNAKREISGELVELGLSIKNLDNDDNINSSFYSLERNIVNISNKNFNMSYSLPGSKFVLINLDNSGFGRGFNYSSSTNNANFSGSTNIDITKITFPYKPGDYVVHSFHGIAYFKDMVQRELNGVVRDYLLLEYAEGDKLFVPIEQFNRITKYVGPQGREPRITRLGTADWQRAMNRASKSTKKMAFDLVDVYSRRALSKGHAFPQDSQDQINMENDFEYIETPDQMQAIEDVKSDMCSDRPMDRLICGDVGFGKTEVALRAAFKCVDDNMQTMLLCPTTILAEQHGATFIKRLEPYGVVVEVLSRFKTRAKTKQIIEDFASGKVDVLVGTHRLLSKDINPHNLGLIIIDEEQRFGVAHKERFKNYRESIDVLSLSATPIPRTMQMATSGVRDFSLIMTPPEKRRAVEVYVGEWDIDIVSAAIRRELARKGQVYYISNRVKTIADAAKRVGDACGEARIALAHGKMTKIQLENIMHDFNSGNIDVLVSTTIVESGLDNPNTNTLIIEDSQNLGLSQMYQLKGRVGRSVNQAYAYFMFSDESLLTQNAVDRLRAIDEFSDLGSGMQIAMRDLEIRGAGNFLGAEQSGNVSGVGFDLFAQMLKSAVELAESSDLINDKLQSAKDILNTDNNSYKNTDYLPKTISDIVVNISESAYFGDDYIPEVDKRVLWYRRFACALNITDVAALESELLQDYPEITPQALNFVLKAKISAYALMQGIKIVSIVNGKLILQGRELSKTQAKKIRLIGGSYNAKNLSICFPVSNITDSSQENTLLDLSKFFEDFYID